MARISVLGDAMVVTSRFKLEELKLIQRCRPEALVLKDEKNEEVFSIYVTGLVSSDTKGFVAINGVGFGNSDTNGFATLTTNHGCNAEDEDGLKEAITDKFGVIISRIKKIEDSLYDVLEEILEERDEVMSNITVIQ